LPKENTHLFFASRLLASAAHRDVLELLNENQREFFLGAVFPDAFFYHPKRSVQSASARLHGIGDAPGAIVSLFLAEARQRRCAADAAFALGYLSHCALDSLFHPVVVELTGGYHDSDPGKRNAARYRHRLLETGVDRQINPCCTFEKMIEIGALNRLGSLDIFAGRNRLPPDALRNAFVLQRRANSLFLRKWAYTLARGAAAVGGPRWKPVLPLFYSHLEREKMAFPEKFAIASSGTTEHRTISVAGLLSEAAGFSDRLFAAAYGLFAGPAPALDRYRAELQARVPVRF